jgi:DNA-binding transcriptional LysR family regulator
MDTKTPDWTLLQSFLAVAETGSLSGAAKQLGHSQPTLGRHISALEHALGVELFERHARGLRLTPTGNALLPKAQSVQQSVNELTLIAAGDDGHLQGTVRITASVFVSHHILPRILAHIRGLEPSIQLELVPSDSTENLLFRAADIAVRMYRPTQLDVVTRHITDLKLGLFAAKTYLERKGRPQTAAEFLQHDLVGYDSNDQIIRGMREAGLHVSRDAFATRCDNQTTYWELVRAGCGIGYSQTGVARLDPLVEELDIGVDIPALPVWLASHENLRRTPRVSRVWDLLADGLQEAGVPAS